MRLLIVLFLLLSVHGNSYAQTDSFPAAAKDVESVDAIMKALYEVISGPAGQARNWNRMRSLFLPEAKMIATGTTPAGEIVKRVMTVEDYITRNGPVLEKNGFFEQEIYRSRNCMDELLIVSAPMLLNGMQPMLSLLCVASTVFSCTMMENAGGFFLFTGKVKVKRYIYRNSTCRNIHDES